MNFLFWNLNRKPLEETVGRLAAQHEIDIVVVAENTSSVSSMRNALNTHRRPDTGFYFSSDILPSRDVSGVVNIFSRLPPEYVQSVYDDQHVSIRHIKPPIGQDVLLIAVHLSSKLYSSDTDQIYESQRLAQVISQEETRVGHKRSVVLGDLNMDPFEHPVIGAAGLHAMSTKRIARRGSRVVKGIDYPMFYNPMWGLFGDATPGPPGTYYYRKSDHVSYFWHMFDQALIRPDLLDALPEVPVRILTHDGEVSLATETGEPDNDKFSDHFPLHFRLEI